MISYRYKTVLLIDDNIIDNLICSKILQSNHYAENVLIKDSPKNAIDYIRESIQKQDNIPEIIFLDIRMPEMTGFDFLNQLELIEGIKDQILKIFILSSSLDPRDFEKMENHSLITKFIGKPLTEHILEEI